MSTKYSKEFKESVIARMLPPEKASVPELARETGIPRDTLYTWRLKYRNTQGAVGDSGSSSRFSNEEKLAMIIETASLNEVELGEYCRRKGLYPEQIAGWKRAFIEARTSPGKAEHKQVREQSKAIRKLQGELNRKEKALAETAALLVLEKKYQAFLESKDADEKSNSGNAKK